MTKKELYICENCKKSLVNPEDGFVVQGNIYVGNGKGGLIGNAFPTLTEKFSIDDIKIYSFCNECFYQALYIKNNF